jgi:hypothetical protein
MPSKDYMAEYRETHAEYVETQNRRNRAMSRALRRLRNENMTRYSELLKEELKKEGFNA